MDRCDLILVEGDVGAADAVVNLAGRTIFKRWTRGYRRQTSFPP